MNKLAIKKDGHVRPGNIPVNEHEGNQSDQEMGNRAGICM